MAILMSMEFPATTEQYDQINKTLDVENNLPDGLIVHSVEDLGGSMRAVDVWESADAYQKFADERLGPAIAEVMGGDAAEGGGPGPEIRELHNVIKG